jgi:hypothetical protein
MNPARGGYEKWVGPTRVVGKSEERPRRRQEDNIRRDLKRIGC